jgi:hypothetical protein
VILYIAGPMSGVENFNYPVFIAADERLRALGFGTLNPIITEAENTSGVPQPWSWYMRRAIAMLVNADSVCLLPGWVDSPGAQLEVHVAEKLGLDIRPFDGWLKYRGDPAAVQR